MSKLLLVTKNLSVGVKSAGVNTPILDAVNFTVARNSTVALVGGSGSGKTTIGLSIMRLLNPALKVTSGEIGFRGRDLLELSEPQMRAVRGREISMVFQEPLYAFNPVFTVGYQIEEVLKYHTTLEPKACKEKIQELLYLVGIPDPQRVAAEYPHRLSGGLRQRAMIAQALAGEPKLIIADEPTSNLDVTLQARIMELFAQLKAKFALSLLLITHDIGMVEHMADTIYVLHQGKIVEGAATKEVMSRPQHEYTKRLLEALRA